MKNNPRGDWNVTVTDSSGCSVVLTTFALPSTHRVVRAYFDMDIGPVRIYRAEYIVLDDGREFIGGPMRQSSWAGTKRFKKYSGAPPRYWRFRGLDFPELEKGILKAVRDKLRKELRRRPRPIVLPLPGEVSSGPIPPVSAEASLAPPGLEWGVLDLGDLGDAGGLELGDSPLV